MRPNYLLGSAIIVGAILTLVGNVLHPVVPPFDIDAYAAEATSADWAGVHAALLIGIVLLSVGFLEVYAALRMKGESLYSLVGLFAIVFAAVLWTIILTADGFAAPRLAADYKGATGAQRDTFGALLTYSLGVNLSLIVPTFLFDGIGVGFVGASLLRARLYPRPLGAVGIVLALITVLGYAADLYGPYFVGNNIFPLVASALVVWILVLGVFVVRGEAPVRVPAPAPERAT